MARGKESGGVGAGIFAIFVLIAVIPKEVWIVLGVAAVIAIAAWIGVTVSNAIEKRRIEAEEQARKQRAADAAKAKRDREEKIRREKQQRIDTMGEKNAARVESAQSAVRKIAASEAAREGWLGDIDFTADIAAIATGFQKAFALNKVAGELSALADPSDDDRKLLAEAKAAVKNLETTAIERVELIGRCAKEARLVDASLQKERDDARTAEQRAELHGKLSAMLYGIEATPDVTPADSAADRVLSRVAAYREIKKQIQLARDM